ncbi:MAG: hypothetical protein IKG85_10090 [Clostridia bacterium]|nr:hypothetical protein [Clostridia bacterium]
MFGKKAKELQELLTQRNSENELMKKRIAELEAENERLREQESLVLRAITEANRTANRIEQEANDERDKLIASAEEQVREAEEKANDVLTKADEEAAGLKKDADDYSENVRLDANIYVERTIIASQMEVNKRKDVMAQMNDLLRKTTDHINEQMASFKELLASVIEENEEQTHELCADIEKCNCSCEECENPCAAQSASAGKPKKGDGEDEGDDEGEDGDEPAEEAEAAPAEEPAEADEGEQPAAKLGADEPEAEEGPEFDPVVLPNEYRNPAELMKNIYYLQKRDIPTITRSDFSDPVPEGGLTFPDELGDDAELPRDEKLGELVTEVMPAS